MLTDSTEENFNNTKELIRRHNRETIQRKRQTLIYKTLYIELKIERQTIQRKRQTLIYKTLYIELKIE